MPIAGTSIQDSLKAVINGLNPASASDINSAHVMLFNATTGAPVKKAPASELISDMAKVGQGYGVCDTASTTVAKTVTISNFISVKYGIVSVLFKNGIGVADATLNVSSTGAKAIKVNGANLQPNVVRPNMVAQLQYDGTSWNLVGLLGLEQSVTPSDLFVDMGLPSGLKWATRSIDLTQPDGFAESPFQYNATFFSWGNSVGQNPTTPAASDKTTEGNINDAFATSWGSANDGPYADTPGAALTANVPAAIDAARVNLGAPWRMPTTEEFKELFDNITYIDAAGNAVDASLTDKRVVVEGVRGLYLKSNINNNTLFFPCSGYGSGTTWNSRGTYGHFWSSSLRSATSGRNLAFDSGGVNPQNNGNRFSGFTVRPVQ